MAEPFKDRYGPWALVVGASAGIGAAAADEGAARGLNLVTVARRGARLDAQRGDLEARYGVDVRPLQLDLAAADAAEQILAATDGIDVGLVIYNAAAEPRGYFLEVPLSEHDANLHINCRVPTAIAHALRPPMVERGRGGIVLVSSLGALQGGKVFTTYFAAKAYLWILAEGLWSELGDSGVDVVAYVVGATKTESYKGQQTEVAGADGDRDDPAFERVMEPADPVDVGRRILDVLGQGPTTFVDDVDAATARHVLALPRRDAVERMSRITAGIRR